MEVNVIPLTEDRYEDAVRIAIEGETGEEKDIRPRLKDYYRHFVAEVNRETIGEIGWYKDNGEFAGKAMGTDFPEGDNVYWISHFAVDKKYKGKGVGTKLIQYLEKIIKKLGGTELWVYTSRARGFYEKQGFDFVQKTFLEGEWEDVLKKNL